MFMKSAVELSLLNPEQLKRHHEMWARLATNSLLRLTVEEQKYISTLDSMRSKQGLEMALASYQQ